MKLLRLGLLYLLAAVLLALWMAGGLDPAFSK
jgi:hypothetical protein